MKRSGGRGPTTPGIGDLLPMVANHLLTGMILQERGKDPKNVWNGTGKGGEETQDFRGKG